MNDQEQDPKATPHSAEIVTDEIAKAAIEGDFRQTLATLEDANANPLLVFLDPNIKGPLWQVAVLLAGSQLVPKHFQQKPADCFLILQAAGRLRVDPLLMLQKTFMVSGKPGFESTFLISLVNQRGGFSHPLRFTFDGEKGTDGRGCTAWATWPDGTKAEAHVSMEMAKIEGWTKNPKYRSMPDQMLAYRAGAFFSRLHCPDVTMGFHTADELQDVELSRDTKPTASEKLGEAMQQLGVSDGTQEA